MNRTAYKMGVFVGRFWWLLLLVIYVIISAVRGQWNPIDWFHDSPNLGNKPTPGSGCTSAAGKPGMYDANGNCIETAPAGGGNPVVERIIITGSPNSFLVPEGTSMPVYRYGCTYGAPRHWRMGWQVVFKLSCP